MKIKNSKILQYATLLDKYFFNSENSVYISARVNFFINKNRALLINACEFIEEQRTLIIQHYGNSDESGNIVVPEDKINIANHELEDLLNIEQDIAFYYIFLSDLEKYDFTPKQMEALFFMIAEDEKE